MFWAYLLPQPNDLEALTRLIQAIPDGLIELEGWLAAPQSLLDNGSTLPSAVFVHDFERSRLPAITHATRVPNDLDLSTHPTQKARDEQTRQADERVRLNYAAVAATVAGHYRVGSLRFREAEWLVNFHRPLLTSFLQLGYRGALRLFDPNRDNATMALFHMGSWSWSRDHFAKWSPQVILRTDNDRLDRICQDLNLTPTSPPEHFELHPAPDPSDLEESSDAARDQVMAWELSVLTST